MATTVEDLERLASLRDRGVLTPEEFEQQKAALLGTAGASEPAASEPSGADFPDFSPEEEAAMAGGYAPQAAAPVPQKGSNKTLFIVLGVVGGVLLLLIIIALVVGSNRRSRPYYSGPSYYSSPYYRPPPRRYYSPPSNTYSPPSNTYSRPKKRYTH